jgi:OOP family OmpA-OmpF porin
MDYSLFGRGYLDIKFNLPPDSLELQVQKKTPPPLSVIIDTLRLDDVLFDFNKSVLKPDAEKILSQYFLIDTNSIIDSMYVEGHTDAMGSDSSNMVLGKQRSEQVKWWLINHQIAPESNIHTQSFGKARPIATNKTPEGRTKNRRVEIIIFRRRK